MLAIQNVENLNANNLNVVKKRTKKSQIMLYDTGRRFDDFVMKLKYRMNGKYADVPHFIVNKKGEVYDVFSTKFSSVTFNNPDVDKRLIKIAIENLGWLNKNTITGILNNWIDDPYRLAPHIKNWRGHFFWDKYTEQQLKAIAELCQSLCIEHKIPYQTVPSQGFLENIGKFKGIVCKSNFGTIYSDINPSFDFKVFYDNTKDADRQL